MAHNPNGYHGNPRVHPGNPSDALLTYFYKGKKLVLPQAQAEKLNSQWSHIEHMTRFHSLAPQDLLNLAAFIGLPPDEVSVILKTKRKETNAMKSHESDKHLDLNPGMQQYQQAELIHHKLLQNLEFLKSQIGKFYDPQRKRVIFMRSDWNPHFQQTNLGFSQTQEWMEDITNRPFAESRYNEEISRRNGRGNGAKTPPSLSSSTHLSALPAVPIFSEFGVSMGGNTAHDFSLPGAAIGTRAQVRVSIDSGRRRDSVESTGSSVDLADHTGRSRRDSIRSTGSSVDLEERQGRRDSIRSTGSSVDLDNRNRRDSDIRSTGSSVDLEDHRRLSIFSNESTEDYQDRRGYINVNGSSSHLVDITNFMPTASDSVEVACYKWCRDSMDLTDDWDGSIAIRITGSSVDLEDHGDRRDSLTSCGSSVDVVDYRDYRLYPGIHGSSADLASRRNSPRSCGSSVDVVDFRDHKLSIESCGSSVDLANQRDSLRSCGSAVDVAGYMEYRDSIRSRGSSVDLVDHEDDIQSSTPGPPVTTYIGPITPQHSATKLSPIAPGVIAPGPIAPGALGGCIRPITPRHSHTSEESSGQLGAYITPIAVSYSTMNIGQPTPGHSATSNGPIAPGNSATNIRQPSPGLLGTYIRPIAPGYSTSTVQENDSSSSSSYSTPNGRSRSPGLFKRRRSVHKLPKTGPWFDVRLYPECDLHLPAPAYQWLEDLTRQEEKRMVNIVPNDDRFYHAVSVALRLGGYMAPTGPEIKADVAEYMWTNLGIQRTAAIYDTYEEYQDRLTTVGTALDPVDRAVKQATCDLYHLSLTIRHPPGGVTSDETFTQTTRTDVIHDVELGCGAGGVFVVICKEVRGVEGDIPRPNFPVENRFPAEKHDDFKRTQITKQHFPECRFDYSEKLYSYFVNFARKHQKILVAVDGGHDGTSFFHAVCAAMRHQNKVCAPGYRLKKNVVDFMLTSAYKEQYLQKLDDESHRYRMSQIVCGKLAPGDSEVDATQRLLNITITFFKNNKALGVRKQESISSPAAEILLGKIDHQNYCVFLDPIRS